MFVQILLFFAKSLAVALRWALRSTHFGLNKKALMSANFSSSPSQNSRSPWIQNACSFSSSGLCSWVFHHLPNVWQWTKKSFLPEVSQQVALFYQECPGPYCFTWGDCLPVKSGWWSILCQAISLSSSALLSQPATQPQFLKQVSDGHHCHCSPGLEKEQPEPKWLGKQRAFHTS